MACSAQWRRAARTTLDVTWTVEMMSNRFESAIDFTMIKPLASKVIGLFICIWVLIPSLVAAIFKGWKYVFGKKERTKPPDVLRDPRWGSHRHVQLPGLRMHYVEKGDHSKPLMIFLHGFPEFWFSWRYQIEYFAKDYW